MNDVVMVKIMKKWKWKQKTRKVLKEQHYLSRFGDMEIDKNDVNDNDAKIWREKY